MPLAHNGDTDLFYEQMGDPDGMPMLLIMGLGAQLLSWDDELCDSLCDHGFSLVRYDNRDTGESTWFDDYPVDLEVQVGKLFAGEPLDAPYGLEDMADDAAAVLDAVGWSSAHIMGASMGGMIAQGLAIRHPERVRSLISIMSTTGDPDVGQPEEDVMTSLLNPVPVDREGAIEAGVLVGRAIGSPDHFNEARSRAITTAEYDRGFNPDGTLRQLLAIISTSSRTEALRALDVPALVIHGQLDRLVTPSGGKRTHEALRGSELIELPEAGHDIPDVYRPDLIDRIAQLAASADDALAATSQN